jgi:hypothetical protein
MFGKRDAGSEVRKEEIEAEECIDGTKGAGVLDVKRNGRPRVRFEIVRFGGKYYFPSPWSLLVLQLLTCFLRS